MNSKPYRWCSVPLCTNTSIKTPNKLFVFVPYEKTIRAKWLRLARRDLTGILPRTQLYFCEDHFDMPNDMENYMKYHLMGSVPQIRMKPGCIPSKFTCQRDKLKRTFDTTTKRQFAVKKQRQMLIEECEKEIEDKNKVDSKYLEIGEPSCGSSDVSVNIKEEPDLENDPKCDEPVCVKQEPDYEENEPDFVEPETSTLTQVSICTTPESVQPVYIKPDPDSVETLIVNVEGCGQFPTRVKDEPAWQAGPSVLCDTEFKYEVKLEPVAVPMENLHDGPGLSWAATHCAVNAGAENDAQDLKHIAIQDNTDTNSYVCVPCGQSFQQRHDLILHTNVCQEAEEFKNQERGKKTKKAYTCDICHKNFMNLSHLKTHLRIHTGERPYSCEICHKDFVTSSSLKDHIRTHTGEKPYFCEVCDRRFSQQSQLNSHKKLHSGDKPYSCEICKKQFAVPAGLRKHLRTHTGEKIHSCELCNKNFSSSELLKTHQRTHTGETPYSCDVCQKMFAAASYLRKHKRIHTGIKPHECEICKKQFVRSTELKKHMGVHSGEKPYSCDVCAKKFARPDGLYTHKKLHKGEKPHCCEICPKRFAQASDLRAHIRVHTGEKPFSCEICEKSFAVKGNLTAHRRIHKAA